MGQPRVPWVAFFGDQGDDGVVRHLGGWEYGAVGLERVGEVGEYVLQVALHATGGLVGGVVVEEASPVVVVVDAVRVWVEEVGHVRDQLLFYPNVLPRSGEWDVETGVVPDGFGEHGGSRQVRVLCEAEGVKLLYAASKVVGVLRKVLDQSLEWSRWGSEDPVF